MRILSTLFVACLFCSCKPVNFAKREGLSLSERARALSVLHLNALAVNTGNVEVMERTIHSESPQRIEDAQEKIEQFSPTVGIRGLKTVSEKPTEIVVEYEQTVEVKHGSMPFSSAIVQTTLARDDARWAIYSTRVVRLIR
jgi:hypothetical protein